MEGSSNSPVGLLVSLTVGVAVAFGLFLAMSIMVAPPEGDLSERTPPVVVDFSSRIAESDTQARSRSLPPPPPEVPKPPSTQSPQSQVAQAPQPVAPMDLSRLAGNVELSGVFGSGDFLSGVGMADAEVMPLVRPPAVYPERAKMRKIEGKVVARLSIRADGTVSDVEVLSSEPAGIFDRAAVRAMYRYRFSPKMEGGVAVAQTATQTVEFRLK